MLAPAVLWLILWAQPAVVRGQLSAFKLQPDQPVPAQLQLSEDTSPASLEGALSLARQNLAHGQKLFDNTSPEQLGARDDEVQKALRLMNARVLHLSQHVTAQRMRDLIRRDSEDSAVRIESRQGFSTAPPYSILMVDDLRNARHAQRLIQARGSVVSIGARCSQVRRFDGIDILVPNSAFLEKNIVNYTLSDQLLRQQVRIGVAFGSPTREVARIITNALEDHGRVLKKPEPVVLFEDFGDSALIFSAFFWVEILPGNDTRMVASDLRHMLDKRFREAGITIAFPQLEVQ